MQEFIVSNLEDENDGDFSKGDLSLREAIAISNSNDTIDFAEDLNGGTIVLSQGELLIDKSLTIDGLGADRLTISTNSNNPNGNKRVFNLNDGTDDKINVVINGLKITGGNSLDGPINIFGGGILNQENLELNDSEVVDNAGNSGGGIYNLDAIAVINNSQISNNLIATDAPVSAGTVGLGGGIASLQSTVEINGSTISGNSNTGIDQQESTLTITNSNIVDNSGLGTGGIRSVNSTLELENTQVSSNSASVLGLAGGISSIQGSTLKINNSIINENIGNAGGADDPQARRADASGILADGTTVISNSTIEGNRGIGFGVKNRGQLNVENSTLANNEGTAIVNSTNATTQIASSTIANNTVSTSEGATAGGIINNQGEVSLLSTIVANNGAKDVPDIAGEVSGSNNLIGNGENLTGLDDSNIVGTTDNPIDAGLGILQDNGGNTPTIALSADSPAIDAGSNPNDLATDQRGEGFDRTVGNGTDIGAFELQTIDNGGGGTPNKLIVSTLEDENDGDFGEGDLSLREAIAIANEQEGEDTISFAQSLDGGTIGLTESVEDPRGLGTVNADLVITDSLNIIGLGANNLTIDGLSGGNGIFKIRDENINFTLEGITLTNGTEQRFFLSDSGGAGAIDFAGANLTLKDAVITGSNGVFTGAISNLGNASIVGSTITDSSSIAPDGSFATGVVNNAGTLQISNSTISENRTPGILNQGALKIFNSTVSNNNQDVVVPGNSGSNLGSEIITTDGNTTSITSSIVAGNSQENDVDIDDLSGEFISGGNNLIADGSGGFINGENGDLVGTADNPLDPLLAELQDNGSNTSTKALLANSPAIDAGSNPNNLATDQRGEGFDRTVGAGTDIGAFELQDSNIQTPDIKVPDVLIPDIKIPDIQIPNIEIPNLKGTDGNDTLKGSDGHDVISGGAGDDSLSGGAGDDLLDGNDGHNNISGDNGHDTLFGGEGNDTFSGGEGGDLIVGAAGHDSLSGNSDRDVINGEEGDDFIDGGEGDDLLTGGAGADTLIGGTGHDVFVLEASDVRDTIVDFELAGDRLQLAESLTLGQLSIVDNESNTGSLILDTNSHDAVVASVENVHAADLEIHIIC